MTSNKSLFVGVKTVYDGLCSRRPNVPGSQLRRTLYESGTTSWMTTRPGENFDSRKFR